MISRVPVFLAAFLVSSWNAPANAADKAQCAAAAEVGQRLTKAHKLVSAREQLLICSNKECPDVISQDCTQWLGEVERSVASVILKPVDAAGRRLDGVHVSENGVAIVDHTGESAVEIDPGEHVLKFERGDLEPAEQHVTLEEGRRNQEIVVSMRPRAVTPPPPPPQTSGGGGGLLAGAIITTSLAVVGGALFAGFGASGAADENALRKSCSPFCTSAQVSPVSTKFAVADAALVTAGVSAIAAVVFWVVWSQHRSPEKHEGHVRFDGVRFSF